MELVQLLLGCLLYTSRHYDELVAENEKLKRDLNSEIAWRNRVSDI